MITNGSVGPFFVLTKPAWFWALWRVHESSLGEYLSLTGCEAWVYGWYCLKSLQKQQRQWLLFFWIFLFPWLSCLAHGSVKWLICFFWSYFANSVMPRQFDGMEIRPFFESDMVDEIDNTLGLLPHLFWLQNSITCAWKSSINDCCDFIWINCFHFMQFLQTFLQLWHFKWASFKGAL